MKLSIYGMYVSDLEEATEKIHRAIKEVMLLEERSSRIMFHQAMIPFFSSSRRTRL